MRTALRAWALGLVLSLGAFTTCAQEELDNAKTKLQLNAWSPRPRVTSMGKVETVTSICKGILASAIT